MQRAQIYLGDDQHRLVAALAQERRTTASAVIREAIDAYLTAQSSPHDRLDRLRTLGARLAGNASSTGDAPAAVESLRSGCASRLESSA